MKQADTMTSNRPYLVRAIYDWICDNNCTPYLLVDATRPGVRVPTHAVKDGRIVLNVAMRAVADLELGNDRIQFQARFGGVSQWVDVPQSAVLAIYAHENGQGMMFPVEAEGADDTVVADEAESPNPPQPDKPARKGPSLRIVK